MLGGRRNHEFLQYQVLAKGHSLKSMAAEFYNCVSNRKRLRNVALFHRVPTV